MTRFDTRFQSDFVLVLACIGVVHFHLAGDVTFSIGRVGHLHWTEFVEFLQQHGLLATLQTVVRGATAIVGLFLISSGYGLTKAHGNTPTRAFLRQRFFNIYLYGFLCALGCSVVVFIVKGRLVLSYWSAFIPVFGFHEFPRDSWVVQYWFLAILFVYYLLFPYIRRVLTKEVFVAVVLASALFGYLIVLGAVNTVSLHHSTICRLSEFCFGVLVAKYPEFERLIMVPRFWRSCLGILVAGAGYVLLLIPLLSPFSNLVFSIGVYWSGVQIAGFLRDARGIVSAFRLLKGGTYTVYLVHLVTISYVFRRFREAFANLANVFLVDTIAIVTLAIIGLIVGQYVERLYYRWAKTKSPVEKALRVTLADDCRSETKK